MTRVIYPPDGYVPFVLPSNNGGPGGHPPGGGRGGKAPRLAQGSPCSQLPVRSAAVADDGQGSPVERVGF
jgi:hypothetical protein